MKQGHFHRIVAIILSGSLATTTVPVQAFTPRGISVPVSKECYATQALATHLVSSHFGKPSLAGLLLALTPFGVVTHSLLGRSMSPMPVALFRSMSAPAAPSPSTAGPATLPDQLKNSRKQLDQALKVYMESSIVSSSVESTLSGYVHVELLATRFYSLYLVDPTLLPNDIRSRFDDLTKTIDLANQALKLFEVQMPARVDVKDLSNDSVERAKKAMREITPIKLKILLALSNAVPSYVVPGAEALQVVDSLSDVGTNYFRPQKIKPSAPYTLDHRPPGLSWAVTLRMVRRPDGAYDLLERLMANKRQDQFVDFESAGAGEGLRIRSEGNAETSDVPTNTSATEHPSAFNSGHSLSGGAMVVMASSARPSVALQTLNHDLEAYIEPAPLSEWGLSKPIHLQLLAIRYYSLYRVQPTLVPDMLHKDFDDLSNNEPDFVAPGQESRVVFTSVDGKVTLRMVLATNGHVHFLEVFEGNAKSGILSKRKIALQRFAHFATTLPGQALRIQDDGQKEGVDAPITDPDFPTQTPATVNPTASKISNLLRLLILFFGIPTFAAAATASGTSKAAPYLATLVTLAGIAWVMPHFVRLLALFIEPTCVPEERRIPVFKYFDSRVQELLALPETDLGSFDEALKRMETYQVSRLANGKIGKMSSLTIDSQALGTLFDTRFDITAQYYKRFEALFENYGDSADRLAILSMAIKNKLDEGSVPSEAVAARLTRLLNTTNLQGFANVFLKDPGTREFGLRILENAIRQLGRSRPKAFMASLKVSDPAAFIELSHRANAYKMQSRTGLIGMGMNFVQQRGWFGRSDSSFEFRAAPHESSAVREAA